MSEKRKPSLLFRNLIVLLTSALVVGLALSLFPVEANYAAPPPPQNPVSLINKVGGEIDNGVIQRTVTFTNQQILPGAAIVDVDLKIVFEKIDEAGLGFGACPSVGGPGHQGGNAYNGEIKFTLRGPTGVNVQVIPANTYVGNVHGGQVTVILNDGAAAPPGGTPTSGTFQPVNPLAAFNGTNPLGVWTLDVEDTVGADPLCFYSFRLTLTTVGGGTTYTRGRCALNSIDDVIYSGIDNPFMADGNGYVTRLRFNYLGGGVAGWLYPQNITWRGVDWSASFINADPNSGERLIAPGEYRVECFGPAGTEGDSGFKVTVKP
ncbi:MAG: hypothetical protein AB1345_11115 [Chloroflexota bacterium]